MNIRLIQGKLFSFLLSFFLVLQSVFHNFLKFSNNVFQVLLVIGFNRQLGISDEWFAIGDSLILTVLAQASFMHVLVLAARLCPEGMEATLFATLMSISNGGSVLGGLIGAGLTQVFGITRDSFDNLSTLIILCNLSSLLPLPLLGLLPKDSPDNVANEDEADIEMKYN